jgi:hypothetical protein
MQKELQSTEEEKTSHNVASNLTQKRGKSLNSILGGIARANS